MSDVVIRAPVPQDVAPITHIANQPAVLANALNHPHTAEGAIRNSLLEPPSGTHVLIAVLDGQPVGQGTLMPGSARKRHTGKIFLFVGEAHWGRGAGRALMTNLLDLADNWIGLRRLQLEVAADNARAISLYESLGFEQEGRLRCDTLTDGVLCDSVVMGRLRAAPEPLREGRE